MPVTEARFAADILPFTLAYEGGFSLTRLDPGNWTGGKVGRGTLRGTNFGIAAASHPNLDIRRLTRAQAATIYWRDYCVATGFDRLDAPVLQVTFDAGVNSGPARARQWYAAAAALTPPRQVRTISAARLAFCRRSPHWATFGRGWSARIAACETRALKMLVPVVPQLPSPPPPAAVRPQPKGPTMKKAVSMLASLAALFGLTSAASAAEVYVAPYAVQVIDSVVSPLLGLVAAWVVAMVGNTARHWLSQKASAQLAANVDHALTWAIGAGVKEAEKRISEEGFVFKVDGIVSEFALRYVQSEFPKLMAKAGGEVAMKVQARLPSHPDLLELKAVAQALHKVPMLEPKAA